MHQIVSAKLVRTGKSQAGDQSRGNFDDKGTPDRQFIGRWGARSAMSSPSRFVERITGTTIDSGMKSLGGGEGLLILS